METEFKQVLVHWFDSAFHAGWKTHEELEAIATSECMLMKSIGWLVSNTDHHVVIAQTVGGTQADGILQIPKKAVVLMSYVDLSQEDKE